MVESLKIPWGYPFFNLRNFFVEKTSLRNRIQLLAKRRRIATVVLTVCIFPKNESKILN